MFQTSIEAINYGLSASAKDRKRLAALKAEFRSQMDRATGRKQYALAFLLAAKAQFCGEALEAKTLDAKAAEIFHKARIKDGAQAGMAQ